MIEMFVLCLQCQANSPAMFRSPLVITRGGTVGKSHIYTYKINMFIVNLCLSKLFTTRLPLVTGHKIKKIKNEFTYLLYIKMCLWLYCVHRDVQLLTCVLFTEASLPRDWACISIPGPFQTPVKTFRLPTEVAENSQRHHRIKEDGSYSYGTEKVGT